MEPLTPIVLALAITLPAVFGVNEIAHYLRHKPQRRRTRRAVRARITLLLGASLAGLIAAVYWW